MIEKNTYSKKDQDNLSFQMLPSKSSEDVTNSHVKKDQPTSSLSSLNLNVLNVNRIPLHDLDVINKSARSCSVMNVLNE